MQLQQSPGKIESRAGILSSPLAAKLLRLVVAASIVESIFIAAISLCLFQSGQASEREFLLLQVSADVASAVTSGRELWEQAGRLRRQPSTSDYLAYRSAEARLLGAVVSVSDSLKRAHADNDIVSDTKASLRELDNQTKTIFQRQLRGEKSGLAYTLWKDQGFPVSRTLNRANRQSARVDPCRDRKVEQIAQHQVHAYVHVQSLALACSIARPRE